METLTITIDAELLEEARQRAGQQEVSGFMNDALKYYLQALGIRETEAELAAKYGPIPDEVREEVAAIKWIG